jgi:hypothetical protein
MTSTSAGVNQPDQKHNILPSKSQLVYQHHHHNNMCMANAQQSTHQPQHALHLSELIGNAVNQIQLVEQTDDRNLKDFPHMNAGHRDVQFQPLGQLS